MIRLAPLALLLGAAAWGGCSGEPTALTPIALNGQTVATQVMAAEDDNSDGQLVRDELPPESALARAFEAFDANSDQQVSAAEIQERIDRWNQMNVALTAVNCRVTLDDKPLEGATVVFEPEGYMGSQLVAGQGETSAAGMAVVSVPPDTPGVDGVTGMYCGHYRVRITHPTVAIPARFGSESTMGQEVAPDGNGQEQIEFALRSR